MKLDLVDVFGSAPMRGNPLGVVRAAEGLSDEDMLRITRWLGFSETTFLLPPTDPSADYRLRIFYPAGELPFAGHPTLGSCHAWLEAGGRPRSADGIVQECGVGLVRVKRDGDRLAFAAPEFLRHESLTADETAEAARLAGVNLDWIVEAAHVVNGPRWKLLRLRSDAEVLAASPVARAPVGTEIGLAGPCVEGAGAAWEVRAFFANQHGAMVEDPVTGSFNAGVALHLFGSGVQSEDCFALQGRKTGADGLVHWARDAQGRLWIGGRCATIAAGARLPLFS